MRPLNSSTVARPELPIRILQVGAGVFLRGFVDWMVHLANDAGVLTHGIAVMKVTPRPETVTPRLVEQDGLFHVVLNGSAGTETTLVTAVREVVNAYDDWAGCLELMRDEGLRLVVSNTTDAGITFVPDDLAATPPVSFPAKVTALLFERWRHFGGDPRRGLTFLPCELIEDNGATLRAMILRHARDAELDPSFVDWVRDRCRFYDTIVDRIVPSLSDREAADLRRSLGFDDRLIVSGERFGHWAIAGDAAIREEFPLDRAGLPVEFLPEIRPYRDRKVRILNGAHTAMAAVGPMFGCTTVAGSIAHPRVGPYVRRLLSDEVLPSLPGDRDDLRRYADAILDRFDNPRLEHRLADIELNAFAKWRTRNLPVVLDAWRAGRSAPLSLTALACLLARNPGEDLSALVSGWSDGLTPDESGRLVTETAALLDGDPTRMLET